MSWRPYFTFDLEALGLLPGGWRSAVEALADGPDVLDIITGEVSADGAAWRFSILQGGPVRAALPWFWDLYHGRMRQFASESFGRPLFPSNRLESTTSLNILSGAGATNDWHRDANPVTGVLFATTLSEVEGGCLEFREADGRTCALQPRAGTFVCFAGPCDHRVAPISHECRRLALPMTYYDSVEDQPFASEGQRY